MKIIIQIISSIILLGCNSYQKSISTDLTFDSFLNTDNSYCINKSDIEQMQTLTNNEFMLSPDSDNKFIKNHRTLNQEQMNLFYSAEEQKILSDYSSFKSYFYGKRKIYNRLLPILIMNTDEISAIYITCFLIDTDGKVKGKFNIACYEKQPNYFLNSYGKFLNDSTYDYIDVSYQQLDENIEKSTLDSSITHYSFNAKAEIKIEAVKFPTDTIEN